MGIESFNTSNVTAVPKVELKFTLDRKGLVNVKAEAINFLTLYLKEQTTETGGKEYLYTHEYVEPIDQEVVNEEIRALNETGANRTVLNMARMRKDIGKKRTNNLNKNLEVEVEYIGVRPMNNTELEISRKKLDDLDAFDSLRIKTMDSRNNLESDIYRRKEWLEEPKNKKYVKDEESETAFKLLAEINEWYEEDGWTANLTTLEGKFKLIKKNFTQIDRRVKTERKREVAIEKFEKELNKTYEDAKIIVNRKNWTEEHYNNTFLKEVGDVGKWFEDSMTKQAELALYDMTDFTGETIESKIYSLRRLLNDLNRVKKPKAPEVLKNDTIVDDNAKEVNGTSTDGVNGTSTDNDNKGNNTTQEDTGEAKKEEVKEEKKDEGK